MSFGGSSFAWGIAAITFLLAVLMLLLWSREKARRANHEQELEIVNDQLREERFDSRQKDVIIEIQGLLLDVHRIELEEIQLEIGAQIAAIVPGANAIEVRTGPRIIFETIHSIGGQPLESWSHSIQDDGSAIYLESKPNDKQKADLRLLLAELVKVVHDSHRLRHIDSLTGLENRAGFDSALSLELARTQRYGSPVSLILIDTDNFKDHNDTHGHGSGDQVLMEIGEILEEQHRHGPDRVARLGGDEFAVILPATELPQAVTYAEKLRETVNQHLFQDRDGKRVVRHTISVGVVSTTQADPNVQLNAEEMYSLADQALYLAKEQRNSVQTAPS